MTTPDRVYFTNWGALADGVWDFDFEPGRDFTRLGEFELDSATALFWDPRPLLPGEERVVRNPLRPRRHLHFARSAFDRGHLAVDGDG